MFDASLMLHDGTTITGDITPVSTTASSGSAVIDLKQTSSLGMSAVLIMGADLEGTSDTILVSIQESAVEGSGYVEVARFPTLTKGTGMPGTYIIRFTTDLRYVRALITTVDSSGSGYTVASVYVLLSPYPFYLL